MPSAIPRPCSYRGCGQLAFGARYCSRHRSLEHARVEDEFRRQYKTARWRAARALVLQRDPVCVECGNAVATVADHVIDAREWVAAGHDFYDLSNLAGKCQPCHDSRTAREHIAGRNRRDES